MGFNNRVAYLINNIDLYGKLIAFCIDNDINVFRTYWIEKEKGKICYNIDWKLKRCFYASVDFYNREGYKIEQPFFSFDNYGKIQLIR